MEKVDARKQTREELHRTRQNVVRLYQGGTPVMQIVSDMGLSWAMVNATIKRHKVDGEEALKPAARGRKQGTGRLLTAEQEVEIVAFIRKRRPRFYGLKTALWNRQALSQLIVQKYGIALSIRGTDKYMDRWGLVPKKAKKLAHDRCTSEICKWLKENYRQIESQANEGNGEIYWLQKPTALKAHIWYRNNTRNKDTPPAVLLRKRHGRDQAPESHDLIDSGIVDQDEALPIDASAADALTSVGTSPKNLKLIAAVTSQGKECWAIIDGSFNADKQIRLIKNLLKDARGKRLFLIRTDAAMFKSAAILDWVEANSDKVRIFPAENDRH